MANVRIQKSEYDIDAFLYEEPEYSEHSYVSSARIDSDFIIMRFRLSREKKAQNLIKSENVRVNHEVISVSSKIPKRKRYFCKRIWKNELLQEKSTCN